MSAGPRGSVCRNDIQVYYDLSSTSSFRGMGPTVWRGSNLVQYFNPRREETMAVLGSGSGSQNFGQNAVSSSEANVRRIHSV